MLSDPWHYPRKNLAKQVLGMFETGLSSALVFFAPRRMGKTEFLRKDILPLAESQHWKVLYFSFLDVNAAASDAFTTALLSFAETRPYQLVKGIKKISGAWVGLKADIELTSHNRANDLKEIISRLGKNHKVLLLMDEIQTLAQHPGNINFIASLRTALDINKDSVKVIFTGSSQEGLRRMFSQINAPFFHFGQNLPFPQFDKHFTDHLAGMFEKITQRALDKEILWNIFQDTQKIPQFIRSLVERVTLNPNLSLEMAKEQLLSEVFHDRLFAETWQRCSALEKLLLQEIAHDAKVLFSTETRTRLIKLLGIENLPISSVQSALRTLQRKELLSQGAARGIYIINDPNFKSWLLNQQ